MDRPSPPEPDCGNTSFTQIKPPRSPRRLRRRAAVRIHAVLGTLQGKEMPTAPGVLRNRGTLSELRSSSEAGETFESTVIHGDVFACRRAPLRYCLQEVLVTDVRWEQIAVVVNLNQ